MRTATRRRIAVPVALTSGMLVSGLLVWHTSYAAFTATTTNPGNSFASGKVAITTSRPSTAIWSAATNLAPGSTDTQCLDVIYSGTVAAGIKLSAAYDASDTTSALAPYLNFTITEVSTTGTSTNASDCAGDTVVRQIDSADATLAAKVTTFSATPADLTWSPSSSETRRYRITYTLQDNTAAQNLTAKVGFTWTAKSTAGA